MVQLPDKSVPFPKYNCELPGREFGKLFIREGVFSAGSFKRVTGPKLIFRNNNGTIDVTFGVLGGDVHYEVNKDCSYGEEIAQGEFAREIDHVRDLKNKLAEHPELKKYFLDYTIKEDGKNFTSKAFPFSTKLMNFTDFLMAKKSENFTGLNENEKRILLFSVLHQSIEALQALYSLDLIHGDVPRNVFVSMEDFSVKIGDFATTYSPNESNATIAQRDEVLDWIATLYHFGPESIREDLDVVHRVIRDEPYAIDFYIESLEALKEKVHTLLENSLENAGYTIRENALRALHKKAFEVYIQYKLKTEQKAIPLFQHSFSSEEVSTILDGIYALQKYHNSQIQRESLVQN